MQNLVKVAQWFLRKASFDFHMLMTLAFNTHTLTQSTNFQVKGCNNFEKFQSIKKQNLTLPHNKQRSAKDHHLKKTMIDWRPRCYARCFVEMGSLVQTKKISEGIYPMIYRRGNHFGHVAQMPVIKFVPLHIQFGFVMPSGFG